jgi:hypothetical protein
MQAQRQHVFYRLSYHFNFLNIVAIGKGFITYSPPYPRPELHQWLLHYHDWRSALPLCVRLHMLAPGHTNGLTVASTTHASYAQFYSRSNQYGIAIAADHDKNGTSVYVTLEGSTDYQWLGLGSGDKMDNSFMLIAKPGNDGLLPVSILPG